MSKLLRLFVVLLTLLLLSAACSQGRCIVTSITSRNPIDAPNPASKSISSATHIPVPTLSPTAIPTPPLTHTQATPSGLAPHFDQILTRVVEIRGLEPLETIVPKFMTGEQLESTIREDLEEDIEDILNRQQLLKVMGMIPQEADLDQMLISLYTEQVVGFYDTETEELYVIRAVDELTPLDELTLAHEYTHALQQQHFDIHAMSQAVDDDSEAQSALGALIEGDATRVQAEYLFTYLTSQERQEVVDASGDSPIFDASPYILRQSLLFPYSQGTVLVNGLLFAGGWEGVNKAYREAPVSTEQVLHPEKYQEGERPVAVSLPDVTKALGQEWEVVYDGVIGEFFLRTYLEIHIQDGLASKAAAGWGGSRFNLIAGSKGEQALVVLLAWDSERDSQEFYDALSSDSVQDYGFLSLKGDKVIWILSPNSSITDEILSLLKDL